MMKFSKHEKEVLESVAKQTKENNDLAKEILAEEIYIKNAPYSPFVNRFPSWLAEKLAKNMDYKA